MALLKRTLGQTDQSTAAPGETIKLRDHELPE